MTYNGWSNYDTWNVALWFDNDGEGLADYVADFATSWSQWQPVDHTTDNCAYCGLIDSLDLEQEMTPDRVAWLSPNLDHQELNDWLEEKRFTRLSA
jgi:hypothetical protein